MPHALHTQVQGVHKSPDIVIILIHVLQHSQPIHIASCCQIPVKYEYQIYKVKRSFSGAILTAAV